MGRPFVIAPQEFYHLYNRGTDKRKIFTCKADYDRFLALLYLCNGTTPVEIRSQGRTLFEVLKNDTDRGTQLVDICGYVLMPNHFHILVREVVEGGTSEFMRKLGNGYTGYFNKRYQRTGTLFQSTYKARHANRDTYLSYLLSYIHLNPIKLIEPGWKEVGIANLAKAEDFLDTFAYSSFPDYCGKKRHENLILNKSAFPTECVAPDDFKKSVKEWLNRKAKLTEV